MGKRLAATDSAAEAAVANSPAARLRALGVKVTPGRVRVLEVLLAAKQPLSHARVEAVLGGAALDRVTLYRVLDSLVGCGLALKAIDADGVYRYSASTARDEHGHHVHFRCVDCGGVFCLDAAPPPAPRLPRGFTLHAVDLDVRGVCARCHVLPAGAAGKDASA